MSVLRVVGTGELMEEAAFPSAIETELAPALTLSAPEGVPFAPIGTGLPLTVELVHVYTGKFPSSFGGSAPMLITSAVKNLDQTGSSSEAVNFLINKVNKRSNFTSPPADAQGTKLICYVPAVTAVSTTVTLTMVFENFPDAAFQQIGSVFSGVVQLPIFLTGSPYLIGAGSILKLAQDVGAASLHRDIKFISSRRTTARRITGTSRTFQTRV